MDGKLMEFLVPVDTKKIIKVIGVGGGGGNAVTHMYKEGIHDVSFVLCNTDNQALLRSDVPVKITLGQSITEGLGAGNKPKRAEAAALESEDDIRTMLSDGTKMVFITAGMGGGTGTGAAPVIAKVAKEMNILTVGIVTIPFLFEGEPKIIQALNGVEEMNRNVDALLVVNNERLREIYHDLTMTNAFGKADDTLAIAAKSIAEIITLPGIINLDFADVETTMKDGGVALMSSGYGQGEGRLEQAIDDALNSPLLNSNEIFNAKKILFNISFSTDAEVKVDELNFISNFMSRFGRDIEVIWGTAVDETLGERVKITLLATGFGLDDIPEIRDKHEAEMGRMTEEQILKEEEEARKAAKDKELIDTYYKRDKDSRKKQIRSVSRTSIAILTLEELNDDHMISILEDTPTYNRDPKLIIRARNKSAGDHSDDISTTPQSGGGKNKISFK